MFPLQLEMVQNNTQHIVNRSFQNDLYDDITTVKSLLYTEKTIQS